MKGAWMGLAGVLATGCAGGGEQTLVFTDAVMGVDVRANQGEVRLVSEERSDLRVDWAGGGVGRDVMPRIEVQDGWLVVDVTCDGVCGAEVEVAMPPEVAIVAALERGELALDLASAADVSACLGLGELSIDLPTGDYALDLSTGLGEVDVEGVRSDDFAAFAILASVDVGSLSVKGN